MSIAASRGGDSLSGALSSADSGSGLCVLSRGLRGQ